MAFLLLHNYTDFIGILLVIHIALMYFLAF